MSRPLRVDVKDGWYHVTARGIERRTIFGEGRECEHCLELLEEMSERYGVEVHAYALMGNHYHLLVRTPRANASAALQWLNVSYSVWFNRRRGRVGPVFQGRFGSVLIDGQGSWALNASVYVHLNPLRIGAYGLGKSANRAEAMGLRAPPGEEVRRRLQALREFRWSSWPAYAGYRTPPAWLRTEELLRRAGGRRAYRRYVQQHVTRGLVLPDGFEDVRGRLALGEQEFQAQVRGWVGRVSKDQPARKQLLPRVPVAAVVKVVEEKWGEAWGRFAERHGDWGRDLAAYLARKRSGLTLRQIGEALGVREYKTVGKAVQRFEASLATDRERQRMVKDCLDELSLVET
jgi:REP element-mobilizing transposase RayT